MLRGLGPGSRTTQLYVAIRYRFGHTEVRIHTIAGDPRSFGRDRVAIQVRRG